MKKMKGRKEGDERDKITKQNMQYNHQEMIFMYIIYISILTG